MMRKKYPRAMIYLTFWDNLLALIHACTNKIYSQRLVERFEQRFAAHFRARHAIALSTARLCLFYTLKALELPAQSEVILPPITISEIVNMIRCAGLKPVFVDLARDSYGFDVGQLRTKITPQTRVILLTHLWGIIPDLEELFRIAKEKGIHIIEDASHSFGAKYKDRFAGTLGRAGFFSLSTLKTVSAYFGGVIVTDDGAFRDRIRKYVLADNPIIPPRGLFLRIIIKNIQLSIATQPIIFSLFTYYIIKLLSKINPAFLTGFQRGNINLFTGEPDLVLRDAIPRNILFYFNDMQAALGMKVLNRLDKQNSQLRANARIFLQHIPDAHKARLCSNGLEDRQDVYWRLPIITDDFRDFQRYLFRQGIDNSGTNLVCCSREEVFSAYSADTPSAAAVKEKMVFIPIHHSFSKQDMLYMAAKVNDYFKAKRIC